MQFRSALTFFCVFLLFVSCEKKRNETITRSFYYWKSSLALGDDGKKLLEDFHVKKLYIKFFDVDVFNEAYLPKSTLRVVDSIPKDIEIVPVIYITNASLQGQKSDYDINSLASNIARKITGMKNCFVTNVPLREVQIDCDWSDDTKDNYFKLLTNLKSSFGDVPVTLTATIRLHQVKYFEKTGVPPVSRGTLMFYNMGKIDDLNGENSIYNEKDAVKYMFNFEKYPLPLDIALPMFSWAVAFRNEKIFALINDYDDDLVKSPALEKTKDNIYKVTKTLRYQDALFMPGDQIKFESVGPREALEAATLIRPRLAKDSITVTLFDFDYNNLKKYESGSIEKVYSQFD